MSAQKDIAKSMRLSMPLRVFYTLNASPQCLLARQRRSVEVVPILEDEGKNLPSGSEQRENMASKQRYAKVLLRTCLGAVCSASPELVCDRLRDYSVYVVDPLESSPNDDNMSRSPAQILTDTPSGNTSSALWGEGVSVGMGLMSWCLAENKAPSFGCEGDGDDGYVVGKFVKDRGADAIEVTMSLRETATQTQHQHALSLSSWGLPTPSTMPLDLNISSSALQSPSDTCPLATPASSQSSIGPKNLDSEALRDIQEFLGSQVSLLSAADRTSASGRPVSQPTRTKPKKIGRPPGAKTHPEKRARQVAIQMHKEKLERLENILKMQNGEEYDKTLVIASECEPKVTDEIITRERKLLEELQSRPLIIDGPRFTTEPLPRRASSPVTPIPLVATTTLKREKKTAIQGNAVASTSSSVGNAKIRESDSSSLESTQIAIKEGREAGVPVALLTSLLGKVDEPLHTNAAKSLGSRGVEKGKEKQTSPYVNITLTHALQQFLPYLSTNAAGRSRPSTNAKVDVTGHQHNNVIEVQPRHETSSAPHSKASDSQLLKTAGESFHSEYKRGPDWPNNRHWAMTAPTTSKGVVPKVREDAHPVPGGGWARGKNIVPRAITSSQRITNGKTSSNISVTPPSASITNTAPDKENMPPTKSKRGLKRSLSSSAEAKETVTDVSSSNASVKRRKQEDLAKGTKSNTRNRVIMSSTETNGTISDKEMAGAPASSPVRSRTSMSFSHNLPVVATSEPDHLSSRSSRTPLEGDVSSDTLVGPLIASPTVAIVYPKTPPKESPRHHEAGESLFTPCAPTSASEFDRSLPHNGSRLGSPSPVSANKSSHVGNLDGLLSLDKGEGNDRQSATLVPQHTGTGWDLPPSSPPPPTSPILPDNDISTEEDQIDWVLAMQLQSDLDIEMEKACTDRKFEDLGTTINNAGGSTPAGGSIHSLEVYDMSDQLSVFGATISELDVPSDDAFCLDELGCDDKNQQGQTSNGIQLDVDELWNSLGPVIAHAQLNVGADSQADYEFYGQPSDQNLEEQGAVDPIKLAEDLKALFGGCVI